jgi:hypothetical protein
MRVQSWVVTVLAVGGSTRTATAQRTVDPVTTTTVSGFTSSVVTWLAVDGGGTNGISAVTWREDMDKPCFMSVTPRNLVEGTQALPNAMDICGVYTTPAFGGINTERTLTLASNPRYFVRGVAVCNNDKSNHRLKGVRIYPAKVWATQEQVDELSWNQQTSLTNCERWDSAVYCPADSVASAIVVHHSTKEITGLALRCRRVTY